MVLREWARLPVGMLETILEYRQYAAVKADYDRDPKPRPDESALRQLVRIVEFAIVHEEMTDGA